MTSRAAKARGQPLRRWSRVCAWLLLLGALLFGCDLDGGSAARAPAKPPAPQEVVRPLQREAHRRRVSQAMVQALRSPQPSVRVAAARALAHVPSPRTEPLLVRALQDPDTEVQAWAALGFGILGGDAAREALLGALAAREQAGTRAPLVRALGLLPLAGDSPALRLALASTRPLEQAAACELLSHVALGGRSPMPELMGRVLALWRGAEDESTRRACLLALGAGRAAAPQALVREIREALLARLEQAPPERQAALLRVLARFRGPASEAVASLARSAADWRVAQAAMGALAADREAVSALARAGRARLQGALQDPAAFGGPSLHVLRAAFRGAADWPTHQRVQRWAGESLESLTAAPDDTPGPPRAWGLAHCEAAMLMDVVRGWPARVHECGHGRVSVAERRELAAAVIAELPGADALRASYLLRQFEQSAAHNEPPAVRVAILRAARSIAAEHASALASAAVDSELPRVLEAVLQLLAHKPAAGAEPLETGAAWAGLLPRLDAPAMVAWVRAVSIAGERSAAPAVRTLADHPSHGVRRRARRLLRQWGESAGPRSDAQPRALGVEPLSGSAPQIVIATDQGQATLRLDPSAAPWTAARLVSALGAAPQQRRVARVLPGEIVELGGPLSGHKSPVFHSERSLAPVETGHVAMLEIDFDVSDGSLFVALAPQPLLTRRHTVFAKVTAGMDALHALQVGEDVTLRLR